MYTEGVKKVLMRKITRVFESKVSQEQYNKLMFFLDYHCGVHKVVPYNIFEKDYSEYLKNKETGVLFYKWLRSKTDNIKKPFNKGRKFVRIIKDFIEAKGDVLAYTLNDESVMTHAMGVNFFDYYKIDSPIPLTEEMERVKDLLVEYLICLLIIDCIDNHKYAEDLVTIFVDLEDNELFKGLINLGNNIFGVTVGEKVI